MTYAVCGKFAKQKGLKLARDERKEDPRGARFKDRDPPAVLGPWRPIQGGRILESDRCIHDVWLSISGDFEDDEQRLEYARQLAAQLNKACKE